MRTCTRCHKQKHEKDFCASRLNRGGLEYWCKECKATYYRGRTSKRSMILKNGPTCQECNTPREESELRMVEGILACRECAYVRRKKLKSSKTETATAAVETITVEVGRTTVTSMDELA